MDRIDRLERSWIIFKIKKILKTASLFVVTLVAGASIVYFLLGEKEIEAQEQTQTTVSGGGVIVSDPKPIEQKTPDQIPPKSANQSTQPIGVESQPTPPIEVASPPKAERYVPTKPKMKLSANYDFITDLDRRVALAIAESSPPPARNVSPIVRSSQNYSQPTQSTTRGANVSMSKVSGLKDLEDAFNRQPTYSKAVDIAETYLKQNEFQEAYTWSLRANELDEKDERSWAVFAQASYKLGARDRAINALKGYLNARSSVRLSALLSQIESDGGTR
ncbi:MAG: CDC27 family protein [Helicobacteraceae bacterium]|jgi:tetratricopeptide (TPR) repeat protein|nr:CDC27 family protein [Helicobacteraceae bacterium]